MPKPNEKKTNKFYRNFALRMDGAKPTTVDVESRSVEMVCATENPVMEYDWEHGRIDVVLLMSGLELPANRQVPLQDTHSRYNASSTIGSFREMRVDKDTCIGRAHFADVASVDETWIKVRDGHLTDCSIGYRAFEAVWVPEGETASIDGRVFEGPVKVVTRWKIFENSVCPIGADEDAKARADGVDDPPETTDARNHEEKEMDKKLRAYLERCGLPKDATDEQANEFWQRMQDGKEDGTRAAVAGGGTGLASTPKEDENQRSVEDILADERQRGFEITEMCRQFGLEDMAAGLVRDGVSVDAARKSVMDELAKTPAEGSGGFGFRSPAVIGTDERDKFRSAATDGLQIAAGKALEKPAPGADEMAGRSAVEMARMCLVKAGHSDAGRPVEMVGRALTTSDLPVILSNIANISLQEGWGEQIEVWDQFCAVGSVSDFKKNTAVRPTHIGDLEEIPEGEEYKYGKMAENFEEYAIATYGKMFAITRQALVNNDLTGVFDIPKYHGEMAKRKVGDIVFAVLIANAAMGDKKALFHSDHKNIMTAAAIGTASLSEGIQKMRAQKVGNRRLNTRAEFILAPTTLEGAAEDFFATRDFHHVEGGDTVANRYAGDRFKRVYDGRLDDDSEQVWYMAGPKGKTIKVFFLDGIQTPYLEMKQGWSVDGVEHKVRIDAGAKAMAWEALLKNAGVE